MLPLIAGRLAESEPEVFGWSRIPKITMSRNGSRIFLSDSGSPIHSFHTSHS